MIKTLPNSSFDADAHVLTRARRARLMYAGQVGR